ncbi:MAG TPA: hypothetical protein VGK73_25285 [Polyangiaceae bacterium]
MAQIKPEHFSELPRYHALTKHRKYYRSEQYQGRADFFTGLKPGTSEIVPLRERKPCIIYPLPKNAANQVVRFTFGESRFPAVSIEEITTENSIAGETLTKEEAEQLEKFVAELVERCELKPGMRRVMRPGVSVGTSCLFYTLRDGKLCIDLANAEDVLPEFKDGRPGSDVVRAVWAYQFEEAVPNALGVPEKKRFWFRQDFDAEHFIEYARKEVKHGEDPKWEISRKVPHGFGFCPVRWIRNISDADSRDIDGTSLFEGSHDEFDALNFALSQRHRGINFWGVPQPWETGVEDDDGPVADGRRSGPSGYTPGIRGDDDPKYGRILGADGRPAVKISPDNKWSYRGENAKVGLLETTGKAFEAATAHVQDIRSRLLEAMSVVLVNVSEIAGRTQQGQMSAKFLELAYEPLLALVDEMRHTWWPYGLQAILSDMLRIVAAKKGEGIWVSGAKNAAKLLERFFIKTGEGQAAQTVWMAPKMTPQWGDYFAAGPEEITSAITAAQTAKDAGLVPADDAAKYVLPYFGREDVNEALEELEEEKLEAEKKAEADAAREVDGAIAVVNAKAKAGAEGAGKPFGGKASA